MFEPSRRTTALLRDARTIAAACRAHADALIARGMPSHAAADLVARADALSQAQALWLADRRSGLRVESTAVLLADADALRDDVTALAGLALRKSRDGLERLASLRDGEGIAELIADLRDLAALARDAAAAFEDINEDPGALESRLLGVSRKLEAALAADDAGQIVSSAKDLRDRLAVLVEDAIDEVRAFAAVAFRGDPDNARRGSFAVLSPRGA
ncbi:MAG: hypothetical protein FJ137_05670 [Deltaproteobacteria bacterium]|nr:hypothetical protein [Deltaproteobacteria bacterium]